MMKIIKTGTVRLLAVLAMSGLFDTNVRAEALDVDDLDSVISRGDFFVYHAQLTCWLKRQVPENPALMSLPPLTALIEEPVFRKALDQRQFIEKHGATNLNAFASVEAHQPFLTWILESTEIMDLYLEAAAPSRDGKREINDYGIRSGTLERWYKLYSDHPDSRSGTCLKLAIATALWPPSGKEGGRSYGSNLPVDWESRYVHYETAYKNKELFTSYDDLLVTDHGKVINSWASDSELAWGREMIKTWRPDLLENEQIPKIVSEVWRRFSPFPFSEGFPTVLAGGGKCGPRAFFGAFICQAFGIPAIGIGQPAHACFGVKAAYPETDPQPGSLWKVHQGRGWQVSDCGGAMWGPEFLAEEEKRNSVKEFSLVEHLRWLAIAMPTEEQEAACRQLARDVWAAMPVVSNEQRAIDCVRDRAASDDILKPKPEPPFEPTPGVIHIEAESFADQEGSFVHDCFTGGKQVYTPKTGWNYGTPAVLHYVVEVPETGTYALTMRTAAANKEQTVVVKRGTNELATVAVPWTRGLWGTTPAVDIELQKGSQTMTLARPRGQRGLALRWLELTARN